MFAALLIAAGCGSDSSFISNDAPQDVVPAGATWSMVLEDEFEGAAGTPPSETWVPEIGSDFGNQQLECTTARPENVSLDGDGHLVLTAREESYKNCAYTSARLSTRSTFTQRYGKFEARMKLPAGQGLWPAFWLLGSNLSEVGWPQCGEIDIMEFRGQNVSEVRGSLHGPQYSGGDNLGRDFSVEADLTEDFHVFGAEWTELGVAFYVDGERFYSIMKPSAGGFEWVFDHPFFLILNLAVGGSYVGDVGEDTVFPAELVVDWVRVYALRKS